MLLKATLNSRFDTNKDAQQFLESCIGSEYKVENIEVKPVKRYPHLLLQHQPFNKKPAVKWDLG